MINDTLIREEYRHLKDVIFVNAAHVIIPPKSVLEAHEGFIRDYVGKFASGIVEEAWDIVDETRSTLSDLIQSSPSEIAFVKNTAEGIGIISNGYPFNTGDEILICDQEHPSNLFPWIRLHELKGVDLKVLPSQKDWDLPEDAFIQNLSPTTKAVVLSAVQFTTGVFPKLKVIGEECRKRGILFIVDGIQAVGRMNINVKDMNIDYMACGSNKGLLGMLGAGFVYCREDLIQKIIPPYVSYQSVENFIAPPALTEDFSRIAWKKDARRFESGNLNYSGILAINEGVKLVNKLGIQNVEDHILSLEESLLKRINGLSLQFRTPVSNKDHWSGIICVYYDPEKEAHVKEILKDHKIYATFRGGYIRIALNFYNTNAQMEVIGKAFEEIAAL